MQPLILTCSSGTPTTTSSSSSSMSIILAAFCSSRGSVPKITAAGDSFGPTLSSASTTHSAASWRFDRLISSFSTFVSAGLGRIPPSYEAGGCSRSALSCRRSEVKARAHRGRAPRRRCCFPSRLRPGLPFRWVSFVVLHKTTSGRQYFRTHKNTLGSLGQNWCVVEAQQQHNGAARALPAADGAASSRRRPTPSCPSTCEDAAV